MKTNREKASDLLEKMIDAGVSENSILEFIINNYLPGHEAYQALLAAEKEFFEDEDSDEDERWDTVSFSDED